jgi:putative ABC transport system permease protein
MRRITRVPGLRRFFKLDRPSDVDDEIQFHLDARVDDLVRLGADPEHARRQALVEFGDTKRYHDETLTIDREYAREVRMKELLASVWSDLGYALRGLRRSPGFTIVAVLTLALGIGATVAVFSAVSGVILRPLPYADAPRIVSIGEREIARPGHGQNTSAENTYDWQRMSRSFQSIGLYSTFSMTLTGAGEPARIDVANVTPGMFDVFHIVPMLGRRIATTDTMQGAPNVTLVSHDFWRAKLGSDPKVVGRALQLNFNKFEIVGVLPENFHGPSRLDRPLWTNFVDDTSDGRSGRSKNVYALLKSGVSAIQAQEEMTGIAKQLEATYPKDNAGSTVVVELLGDTVFGDMRRPLYLLLGASGLVLLIACANISNLLVARGIARGREVAMRAALGAGRGRIARQLLTESFLLSALGSLGGVAIAYGAMTGIRDLGPTVFAARPPALNIAVLAFTILLAAASTLLFGFIPALRLTRGGLYNSLRVSGRVIGAGAGRTRNALALAQLALAVVLLSASALVIKSFARVLRVEPGVRTDNMLYGDVWLPRMRYDSTKSIAFYTELSRRLAATPGVRAVGMTSQVPFSGYLDRVGISRIGGRPELQGSEAPEGDRYVVTPSYFATMGIKLLKGRVLTQDDRFEKAPVAVVDELFAKRAFGDADPIGQTMKLPLRKEYATVVGVVSHVKTYGLDATSPGQIYMSNAQYPWRWLSVVVHTTGDPAQFAPTLSRVVASVDPDEPVSNVNTMQKAMDTLLKARRFALTLLGAFAGVAIVLAAIGLYGVVAYGVTQRRRELGVRVALGARSSEIARMIVAEGARIAVLGAIVGGIGAIAVAKLLSSLLFEVNPRDPAVLAGVSVGLVAVALVACLIPARRAMRVDAAEVLRGD